MSTLTSKAQLALVGLFGGLIGVAYGFGIYLFPAIAPSMIEEFGFTYGPDGDYHRFGASGVFTVCLGQRSVDGNFWCISHYFMVAIFMHGIAWRINHCAEFYRC